MYADLSRQCLRNSLSVGPPEAVSNRNQGMIRGRIIRGHGNTRRVVEAVLIWVM